MAWRVGVDSGGTFTDVCFFHEETGQTAVWKTASTPDDPSRGIAIGVTQGLERLGVKFSDVSYFGHGTTVATNALIQQRGAKTGLLTTDGFRDLLEIGRQRRPDLYDMMAEKPPVLVPRQLRCEAPERLRADGSVERPLDLQAVGETIEELVKQGVEAIAVCFLYSFLRPDHEKAVGTEIACRANGVFVSLSHEVAPEFREFERSSTTVVNAFLGPVMRNYIQRLERRLGEAGLKAAPHLTQSNGGVIGFLTASNNPVRTLLSGPSTGVIAAQAIAETIGIDNVITFDMGGTSSDVALLENRVCKKSGEAEIHGYPIKAPMLDIHTVGAGGGSVAVIDSGGLLKVGPESAGADPGPVCYGLGGARPTVTDANIVLGTLNPAEILGGRMKVRRDLAVAAVNGLADQLGMGLYETAQGIVSVATANMAKAIRVISVQRGYDPRDYALIAFGGGGPLHAVRLARELDVSRVVVPPTPGTLCALGLLQTDLKADFAQSRLMTLSPRGLDDVAEGYAALEAQAEEWFICESIAANRRRLLRSADLRYVGQNYELQVPFPVSPDGDSGIEILQAGFEAAHRQRFGFIMEGDPIELVTLRLEAVGIVQKATLGTAAVVPDALQPPKIVATRETWMPEAGGTVACAVFARADLCTGHTIEGPAIIEQMDTTTLVPPGTTGRIDEWSNLILDIGA